MYVCMRERERDRQTETERIGVCIDIYMYTCVWVHTRLIESTIIPIISQPAVGDFTFGDKGLLS